MKTGFVGNFQPRWHSECISPMVECISHYGWVYIPPWLSVYSPMIELYPTMVGENFQIYSIQIAGWIFVKLPPSLAWSRKSPPYCYPKKLFTPLKAFFLENSPPPILLIGGTVKRNIKWKGVDKVADFIIRTSD